MNVQDQSFFSALMQVVQNGESLQFRIEKTAGKINIALIPELNGEEPETKDAGVAQIRAALAMPLIARNVEPQEGLLAMAEKVMDYGEARSCAHSAYQELINSLKDATASAKNATKKSGASKTATKQVDDDTASKPAVQMQGAELETEPTGEPKKAAAGGLLDF